MFHEIMIDLGDVDSSGVDYIPWMARNNNYRRGWKTVWSLRKIEGTFASGNLSINSLLERVLGRIKSQPDIRRRTVQGLKLLRWRVPIAVLYMSCIGAKSIPHHLRSSLTGNF